VDAEIAAARDLGMFEMLDLLALNESEAESFTGCHFSLSASGDFVTQCRALTDKVHRRLKIVVTAGKRGALAFSEGQYNFCPAPEVTVASTAGSGDALLGGVLCGLALGVPFLRADAEPPGGNGGSIASAFDLGVLLGSYKVTSPHTIHPSACLDTLRTFAKEKGIELSADLASRAI
jgi:sugar/nucleoside kinase (ribokinase family)